MDIAVYEPINPSRAPHTATPGRTDGLYSRITIDSGHAPFPAGNPAALSCHHLTWHVPVAENGTSRLEYERRFVLLIPLRSVTGDSMARNVLLFRFRAPRMNPNAATSVNDLIQSGLFPRATEHYYPGGTMIPARFYYRSRPLRPS
jgi:hypothetical protein